MKRIHVLIIDPQIDFMDSPNSALPVKGANADMHRLAVMIDRIGKKIEDIHITMDSHHVIDVGHPGMWRLANGKLPSPYTIVTSENQRAGIIRPRNENSKPSQLGGKTLGQYMLGYSTALEKGGKYPLMIWPEHCIIGTPGHNIHPELNESVTRWERDNFATADHITKGTNPFTEHYGALQAEVPMATDPTTGLNTLLLNILSEADIIVAAGEALSHCKKETITQIADNIGAEHIKKFHLLTDCSSPVPQPPGGPDFPAIAQAWLKEMEGRGMVLTTSEEFLS